MFPIANKGHNECIYMEPVWPSKCDCLRVCSLAKPPVSFRECGCGVWTTRSPFSLAKQIIQPKPEGYDDFSAEYSIHAQENSGTCRTGDEEWHDMLWEMWVKMKNERDEN